MFGTRMHDVGEAVLDVELSKSSKKIKRLGKTAPLDVEMLACRLIWPLLSDGTARLALGASGCLSL